MTTIYLINNALTMNNLAFPETESLISKREKRILSIEGEEESKNIAKLEYLQKVNSIYTSNYVMSIATAKYLAQALELEIQVVKDLNERLIGDLGNLKIRAINEMQEANFDFKLNRGESLNEVKFRLLKFIKKVTKDHPNQEIAMFTHNVAITALLSNYCTKGFNLDNRLILNYQDKSIIDGSWDGIRVFKLVFDDTKLIDLKREI